MSRGLSIQLFLCLGMLSIGACSGVQAVSADSDFEGANWEQFEYKTQGKTITFEFPVNVPGATTFEFNPDGVHPGSDGDRDNAIIILRTHEKIGWVHATSGINISINVFRYRGVNPDGSWAPYYKFSNMREAFRLISNESQERSGPIYTRIHSLIKFDEMEWIKTVSYYANSQSHAADKYRTILNQDYMIGVSYYLGSRGQPDETRLAELRKAGERIVRSLRIQEKQE